MGSAVEITTRIDKDTSRLEGGPVTLKALDYFIPLEKMTRVAKRGMEAGGTSRVVMLGCQVAMRSLAQSVMGFLGLQEKGYTPKKMMRISAAPSYLLDVAIGGHQYMTTESSSAATILEALTDQSEPKSDQEYLIDSLIPKGQITCISADPGHGNSTLVLKWCYDIRNNNPEMRVVYLDRSNAESVIGQRMAGFGKQSPGCFIGASGPRSTVITATRVLLQIRGLSAIQRHLLFVLNKD